MGAKAGPTPAVQQQRLTMPPLTLSMTFTHSVPTIFAEPCTPCAMYDTTCATNSELTYETSATLFTLFVPPRASKDVGSSSDSTNDFNLSLLHVGRTNNDT